MKIKDLLSFSFTEKEDLQLRAIAGMQGGERDISVVEINRPGLALSGFFDNFGSNRVQLFGRGEYAYISHLDSDTLQRNVGRLMEHPVPCVVFSHDMKPPESLVELADTYQCPLLTTRLTTSEFSIRFIRVMSTLFAPRKLLHGVHVEVFGVGVLIMGGSGAGKSETALELIERGHRLVADDAVEVYPLNNGHGLLGRGKTPELAHFMEIRGLGIINIPHLFGVGAVRDVKQVQLIVELESWEETKEYERLGDVEKTREILGVNVLYVQIPVRPGRNISIIIEVAAMNVRLKYMGYNAARELDRTIKKRLMQSDAQQEHKVLMERLGNTDEGEI